MSNRSKQSTLFSSSISALAQINLANLDHNLQLIRKIAPNTSVMAMLKANAYGHGQEHIALHLDKTGINAIAVARQWEAESLIEQKVNTPIVILSELITPEFLAFCSANHLQPVIHDKHGLSTVGHALQQGDQLPTCLWLKLNTGMNRLGLSQTDYRTAIDLISQNEQNMEVRVLTHFSSADECDKTPTEEQIKRFKETTDTDALKKSLANSAGILSMPEAHADWVRPGIMLYGVNPLDIETDVTAQLKPVMELTSRVIAIHTLKDGDQVGYNRTWTSKGERKIATVSIGYGDGYPRHAKNGTPVLIHGQKAPLVGRVSMDMITIDITDIKSEVNRGDIVTLWGEELSVNEIAKHCDTIGYELLTGISRRVKYLYTND